MGGYIPTRRTVLSKEDVVKIREEYVPIVNGCNVLSAKYNIGPKTILDIVNRVTWKHI